MSNDKPLKDLRRVERMNESLHAINSYKRSYLEASDMDDLELLTLTKDAINMRIQDITENSVNVSDRFKAQFIEYLPWDDFKHARNLISHNYEGFDDAFVEGFINNIEQLIDRTEEILDFYSK